MIEVACSHHADEGPADGCGNCDDATNDALAETASVTRYEQHSQRVSNAAPHHTTPHHTTKSLTSSRSDALARGRAEEQTHLARLADIHPIDALAKLVLTLRPDWTAKAVVAWASTDDRPWVEVVRAATRADDRDIRTPGGLRYVGSDNPTSTPLPPSLTEWRNADRCDDHGAIRQQCALCRRGIGATT